MFMFCCLVLCLLGRWMGCGGLGMVVGLNCCFVICVGWYDEYENGLFELRLFVIGGLFFGILGICWE